MRSLNSAQEFLIIDVVGLFPPNAEVFIDDMDFNKTNRGNFVIEPYKRRSSPIQRHILSRSIFSSDAEINVRAQVTITQATLLEALMKAPGVVYPQSYASEVAEEIFDRLVGAYMSDVSSSDFSNRAAMIRIDEVEGLLRADGEHFDDAALKITKQLEDLTALVATLQRAVTALPAPPPPSVGSAKRWQGAMAVLRSSPHDSFDSPRKAEGPVGLTNDGVTCYLNAYLQALFHLPFFRRVILSHPPPLEGRPASILSALQTVFWHLLKASGPASSTVRPPPFSSHLTPSLAAPHDGARPQRQGGPRRARICARVFSIPFRCIARELSPPLLLLTAPRERVRQSCAGSWRGGSRAR
jgi:hypothetical protein